MKKIYPNCYDVVPMPTKDGYILFSCDICHEKWLYHAEDNNNGQVKCPYCGNKRMLNQFYQYAYKDIIQYYHLIALKNLLELIGIEIDIIDTNNNYEEMNIKFINIKQPDDNEMGEYVKKAYEELNKRALEKSLDIQTRILIEVNDIINLEDLMEIRTTCCKKPLQVKTDKKTIKHCIYCNSDF